MSLLLPAQKKVIYQRDGYRCRDCDQFGEPGRHHGNLQVHHIVPSKRGGSDDGENLLTLCLACHRARDRAYVLEQTRESRDRPVQQGPEGVRNRVGYWRRHLGYDRSELARMAGIAARTLRDIESGYRTPRDATLRKVAGILGVEVASLREVQG